MADSGDVIKTISDNIEKIFRHMLPGVWVLLAAYWSHSNWFSGVDFTSGGQLTLLAVVALAVGNVWYVAHRYSLHQLIDFISYWIIMKKPLRYFKWLSEHIANSFRVQKRLRNNLHARSSQIIFLFIVSEIALVFVYGADACSFFHKQARGICWVAGSCLAVAILGQYVAFTIDVRIASDPNNYCKDKA